MSDTSTQVQPGTAPMPVEPRETAMRIQRLFSKGDFVDQADAIKWAVNSEKGSMQTVGFLKGRITGVQLNDPTEIDKQGGHQYNLSLIGDFEGSTPDGEAVYQATLAYTPRYYMERIKRLFEADADLKAINIDIALAIEATGRNIPYAWIVIEFDSSDRFRVTKARNARRFEALQAAGTQLALGRRKQALQIEAKPNSESAT